MYARPVVLLRVPFVVAGAFALTSCLVFDGAESLLEKGGGGSGATGGVGGSGGGQADPECVGEVADGFCEYPTEDCECVDCLPTGVCIPGACVADGTCGNDDSCTCTECDGSPVCGPSACTPDDVCDPFLEGCICADCWTFPGCADNIQGCAGTAPDGICAAPAGEQCSCPDCLGYPSCTPCIADDVCSTQEGCFCPECADEPICNTCDNDGICYATSEECLCPDCVGQAPCP